MNNITIKQPNKTQVKAFNNTFNGLLTMQGVDNLGQAQSKILTALTIADKTLLPLCKAFAIVKNKQLFTQPTAQNPKGYKNLEQWAKNEINKSKSTSYNYAKVGEFVDEAGFNTIFAEKDENGAIVADFDYYGILEFITACTVKNGKEFHLNATKAKMKGKLEDGTIIVGMDASVIKKVLKTPKGEELEQSEQPEQPEQSEQPEQPEQPEQVKQKYDTLDTVRKSALYIKYEPVLAQAIARALNDNDISLGRIIDEFIELTGANE